MRNGLPHAFIRRVNVAYVQFARRGQLLQREPRRAIGLRHRLSSSRRLRQTPKRPGAKERQRLILENLPQVRMLARRIYERLPVNVSYDDLVSTGVLGLIAAIDGFDPARNVKLKTYAEYKIRGAIFDGLRSLDWAPRGRRKHYKQIEGAVSALQQRLHRAPAEDEVAAELKLTIGEYRRWLVEIRGVNLSSLDASSREEGRNRLEQIADDRDQSPFSLLERSEHQRLVRQAIARIPRIEQVVIELHYQKEKTL